MNPASPLSSGSPAKRSFQVCPHQGRELALYVDVIRQLDFVAVQEVGRVLDETLARGQIQGGVVQGIGWTLYEDVAWE